MRLRPESETEEIKKPVVLQSTLSNTTTFEWSAPGNHARKLRNKGYIRHPE